jgi:hypothetical protein
MLYPRSRKLPETIVTAIRLFGKNPSEGNRERLVDRILRFGYRRKYDGEFLTPKRASGNVRTRK